MDLPGLDFRPGLGVQSAVLSKFGLPVSLPPDSRIKDFLLVVSFGRCKFRLTEDSVSHILQATIGGSAAEFRPVQLADRVFSFKVSAKVVGFHIYNLRSYECLNYKLYFNLWGNGGASWPSESQAYVSEEADSWQLVTSKKKRKSYADAAKQIPLEQIRLL